MRTAHLRALPAHGCAGSDMHGLISRRCHRLVVVNKKRPNNSKQLPLILLLQALTGRRSSGHISGTLKLIPPKNTFLCYYRVQGFAQFL